MARKVGDEGILHRLHYSQLARWAGLRVSTVRAYASRGDFDRHSIESMLEWVNGRRAAKGLPAIGAPPENNSEVDTCESGTNDATPVIATGYNPLTGEFTNA